VGSQPDRPSLAELQGRFAAALGARGAEADAAVVDLAGLVVDDGLSPASRVQVYRNNVRALFTAALERTFPVLRRRVGDAYFQRLALEYRAEHPSRSGDLHWVGEAFPRWLAARVASTDFTWLGDLARLEWACEEALVAERRPPLEPDALARVAPERLGDIGLVLQPGLRLVSSPFPIWSVWQANQPGAPGDPVDPGLGPQHVAVTCASDGLVLHSIARDQFLFVAALVAGDALGQALEASALDVEQLPGVLAWLFGEDLVTALRNPVEAGIA
jgi:hypothetical protein